MEPRSGAQAKCILCQLCSWQNMNNDTFSVLLMVLIHIGRKCIEKYNAKNQRFWHTVSHRLPPEGCWARPTWYMNRSFKLWCQVIHLVVIDSLCERWDKGVAEEPLHLALQDVITSIHRVNRRWNPCRRLCGIWKLEIGQMRSIEITRGSGSPPQTTVTCMSTDRTDPGFDLVARFVVSCDLWPRPA